MKNNLESLIHRKISRRKAIKTLSGTVAATLLSSVLPENFLNIISRNNSRHGKISFKPIEASDLDELILPEGFSYNVIRKWGDKISDNEYYGYNNDYCIYLPIDMPQKGNNSEDGLLFINHEYPHPLFVSGYTLDDLRNGKPKSAKQVELEKKSMGVSIFRVRKQNGNWSFVNDPLNRRYDGYSRILLSGDASGSEEVKFARECTGTVQNCSGGITPWGTVLSAEENFQDCLNPNDLRWGDADKNFIEEHYGWMVEFNPFDPAYIPKKRTSLGRFRHENIAVITAADGRVVCYMGDDKSDEHVYKFVSSDIYNPVSPDPDILDKGILYAADFKNSRWLAMDYNSSPILRNNFRSQADVLVRCSEAAGYLGATECNRPEDIEINPMDNSVFIAFTNNYNKDDHHGSIVRLIEKNNDHTSEEFTWEVFATGGAASGFSCPDNLYFDSSGNLWVLSDIGTSALNRGIYREFKNNSLFMIPTCGENKGRPMRFASGPVDSEMCGVCFTPDEKTMFLSIQHPGENTTDISNPTSRWPLFGNDIPRPAVVTITGFK